MKLEEIIQIHIGMYKMNKEQLEADLRKSVNETEKEALRHIIMEYHLKIKELENIIEIYNSIGEKE